MPQHRTFEFKAGARCLDLVDTVASRASEPLDLLSTTDDLARWLRLAGFVPLPREPVKAKDLGATKLLREAIYRVAKAISAGTAPRGADIQVINTVALKSAARPQLTDGVVTYCAAHPMDAALAAIAADAIEHFSVEHRDRIRTCPQCQMLFFDTSRPGRRRWCSSASGCGNRAKVRRYRQARQAELQT